MTSNKMFRNKVMTFSISNQHHIIQYTYYK